MSPDKPHHSDLEADAETRQVGSPEPEHDGAVGKGADVSGATRPPDGDTPSRSMEPTLNISDRVLVEKVSYRFGEVKDGDVIVFVHDLPGAEPESSNPVTRFFTSLGQAVGVAPPSDRDFIKRVVGTPGDRITCQQGKLYRNDHQVSEPYLAPGTTTENCTPTTVAAGKLFVMGDNRNNSEDSRTFGPIDRSTLVGRAFVRIWPLSHTGWLRRDQ